MLDEKDTQILKRRQDLWDEDDRIRVGDRLILPNGEERRVAHIWDDGVQPTTSRGEGMCFYLSDYAMSYSGGLDACIPFDKIQRVDGQVDGSVWFFHHGHVAAHNGVLASALLRIYKVVE